MAIRDKPTFEQEC